jgi:hypothetical protein
MPNQTTRWYLPVTLLLNSLALTLTGMFAAAANAEFQSTARTALVMAVFVLAALMLAGSIWYFKNPTRGEQFCQRIASIKQPAFLNTGIGLLFAISWALAWLPAEKSGSLYYYFIGIQPLFGWLAFSSGLALLLCLALRPDFSVESGLRYWKNQTTALQIALFSLLFFGMVTASILLLKIWASEEPFYYGAGVPLLAWQVYALVLATVLLRQFRIKWPRHADAIIFLAVWAISAVLWASLPLESSFFLTPPYSPNYEFYPFSDAELFDRASQYALIGQGINNGQFFDRTLYIALLVYLHSLFGQNYELIINTQAALFAVFPAVVYLIGKNLHSRPAGLLAASIASWRGLNALLVMPMINTSTAKQMMTDFPTGLGLAFFCLFAIEWLKDPQKDWHKAAWAAGVLSLTSLLRPHVLLILLAFLAVAVIVYLPHWRRGFGVAALGLFAFVAGIAPWTFFSGNNTSIIELYATRIRSVIYERYRPVEPPQLPNQPAKPGLLSLPTQEEQPIEVVFPANHFLNNLQTSALGLPITPQFISLRETVKSDETIWKILWQGELSSQATVMLAIGLAVVALGVGAVAQKSLRLGLLLPAVFLIYASANSLARTSGGRYVVPIDWILFLFFGVGLWFLVEAASMFFQRQPGEGGIVPEEKQPAAQNTHWAIKAAGAVTFFVLVGGLIPLSQHIHPKRYQPETQEALLTRLEVLLPQVGLEKQAVADFLQQDNAVLVHGAALYPRHLGYNIGFPSWYPYNSVQYPRTIFTLIGPQERHATTTLFGPSPNFLPHNSDVIVLACKWDIGNLYTFGAEIFDALLVALPGEQIIYKAAPERPLQCPVAPPVCDNKSSCR